MSDALNAATFGQDAARYARARPTYPDALFDWLLQWAPSRRCAWDVGCGSGQATLALAARFDTVIANDIAAEQIAQAPRRPNIRYEAAAAEDLRLAPASVDLVTVATAVHWFDLDRFYPLVQRALAPRGVFAAFGYGTVKLEPPLHDLMRVAFRPIKPYWSEGNVALWKGYPDLPLPFTPLAAPDFVIELDWTLDQFLDYAGTWSALKRHAAETGTDLIAEVRAAFADAWGPGSRRVRFPLALRAGLAR
jgi:SAM-dependent methyltransferase